MWQQKLGLDLLLPCQVSAGVLRFESALYIAAQNDSSYRVVSFKGPAASVNPISKGDFTLMAIF